MIYPGGKHSENLGSFLMILKISYFPFDMKCARKQFGRHHPVFTYADNTFLPFALLAERTFLPLAVFILARNP